MRKCDAVVTVAGWQHSEGSKREIAEAALLSIPVMLSVSEFRYWLTHKTEVAA